ncbi:hypothetical protein B0H13DRAFT_2336884 [Mycena leptocephala]|nr:hypothetical protein B0H13DRAFT_2336884 [Mycena leptocephala]
MLYVLPFPLVFAFTLYPRILGITVHHSATLSDASFLEQSFTSRCAPYQAPMIYSAIFACELSISGLAGTSLGFASPTYALSLSAAAQSSSISVHVRLFAFLP